MAKLPDSYTIFCESFRLLQINENGIKCSYYFRQGKGKALLLFPGILGDSRYWFQVLCHIPKDISIIAINYPQISSLEDFNKIVSAILRLQNIQDLIILGQSFGGYLAQLFRTYMDIKIRGIILSNTAAGYPPLSKKSARRISTRIGIALLLFKLLPVSLYRTILKSKLKRHTIHFFPEDQHFWVVLFNQIVNEVCVVQHLSLFKLLKNIYKEQDFSISQDTPILILDGKSDTEFNAFEKRGFMNCIRKVKKYLLTIVII